MNRRYMCTYENGRMEWGGVAGGTPFAQ